MCEFKPGDEVAVVEGCLDEPILLVVGAVHTVMDVKDFGDQCGPRVFLHGVDNGSEWPEDGRLWFGFDPGKFRKVQRRDLSAWLKTATKFEEPKRKKANA